MATTFPRRQKQTLAQYVRAGSASSRRNKPATSQRQSVATAVRGVDMSSMATVVYEGVRIRLPPTCEYHINRGVMVLNLRNFTGQLVLAPHDTFVAAQTDSSTAASSTPTAASSPAPPPAKAPAVGNASRTKRSTKPPGASPSPRMPQRKLAQQSTLPMAAAMQHAQQQRPVQATRTLPQATHVQPAKQAMTATSAVSKRGSTPPPASTAARRPGAGSPEDAARLGAASTTAKQPAAATKAGSTSPSAASIDSTNSAAAGVNAATILFGVAAAPASKRGAAQQAGDQVDEEDGGDDGDGDSAMLSQQSQLAMSQEAFDPSDELGNVDMDEDLEARLLATQGSASITSTPATHPDSSGVSATQGAMHQSPSRASVPSSAPTSDSTTSSSDTSGASAAAAAAAGVPVASPPRLHATQRSTTGTGKQRRKARRARVPAAAATAAASASASAAVAAADSDTSGGNSSLLSTSPPSSPRRTSARTKRACPSSPELLFDQVTSTLDNSAGTSQGATKRSRMARDLGSLLWAPLQASGAAPAARWGHSMWVAKESGHIMVYGGSGDQDSTLGDCFTLDPTTQQWSKTMSTDTVARVWHACAQVPKHNLVVAFGGERDISTGATEKIAELMTFDSHLNLWYKPTTLGKAPSGRSGLAACTMGDDQVIFFGGNRGRKWLSELWVLNVATWRWSMPHTTGKAPCGRTYHTSTAVGDKVVFFGGNNVDSSFNSVHVLDTSTQPWSWVSPCMIGTPPKPRAGHTATLVSANQILVSGGWDDPDSPVYTDAFMLNTDAWEWTPVDTSASVAAHSPSVAADDGGAAPAAGAASATAVFARVGHGAVATTFGDLGYGVLMFGGVDAEGDRRNDMAFLPLPSLAPSDATVPAGGAGGGAGATA